MLNGTSILIQFLPKLTLLFKDVLSFEKFVKDNYNSQEEEKTHKFLNLEDLKDQKLSLFLKKLNKISLKILKKLEELIKTKFLMLDLVDGMKILMHLK
jgi:hypothetical protein